MSPEMGVRKYLRLDGYQDVDEQPLDTAFEQLEKFINELKEDTSNSLSEPYTLLVHCNQGKSRSASLMLYMFLRESLFLTYDEALVFLRSRRWIVRPNPGFDRQ